MRHQDTTHSVDEKAPHRRWCPICKAWRHGTGPCRRAIVVVGLEVLDGDTGEGLAVCDNAETRDKIAKMLRESVG